MSGSTAPDTSPSSSHGRKRNEKRSRKKRRMTTAKKKLKRVNASDTNKKTTHDWQHCGKLKIETEACITAA